MAIDMILSHSGWRGIFAADGADGTSGEESKTGKINAEHRVFVEEAATVFADYLRSLGNGNGKPLVLIGRDTRPTGKAIAAAMIPVLRKHDCRVRYAGIVAAPEIMAWARALGHDAPLGSRGFIYISASHNPIGHNGLKFGLADGGILPAEEAAKLAEKMGSGVCDSKYRSANNTPCSFLNKKQACKAYYNFSGKVAWGDNAHIADALKQSIARRPLGVCCDFNGSARCVSIDKKFFGNLGIKFKAINDRPGAIAHRIVPEGESLDPCCAFLEEQHRRDPAFVLGYVPDCDGDRGNLVIWDGVLQKARALEAQEVFALACVAELAHLAWVGNADDDQPSKIAVVVNDPTSLRIDRIAEAFGARVFRAEVGEANVVGLARRLRADGYTVRILGEGSAGGNITHPSAVRDPLHTVLAIAKLLSLRTATGKPGLFELWCNASNQAGRYRADFELADIIASMPPFITTGAYSPEAALRVTSADHGVLKRRYQSIFLREWEERKNELKANYGIYSWEAAAYNGMEERKDIGDFGEAGKGGLKICFYNANGKAASAAAIASIWMRGSATEPVFRVIADAEGSDRRLEHDLIEWQRRMTMEADRS